MTRGAVVREASVMDHLGLLALTLSALILLDLAAPHMVADDRSRRRIRRPR
jgi:hypothetical protein